MKELKWENRIPNTHVLYVGEVPMYSINKRAETMYSIWSMFYDMPPANTLEAAKNTVLSHLRTLNNG